MSHNNQFWEHITDHLIIAVSFLLLGMFLNMLLIKKIRNRVRIDYDLAKGDIMRVFGKNGKQWIICNPSTIMEYYDIVLMAYFDNKGTAKTIEYQNLKRVKIISRIVMILVIILIFSGVLLIFSAFETDLNPICYIHKWIQTNL